MNVCFPHSKALLLKRMNHHDEIFVIKFLRCPKLWTFLSKNCLNGTKSFLSTSRPPSLEIELNVEWNHYPPKLTDLLNRISNSLPSWSLLRGTNIPLPILYIDEANLLWELVIKDVNGQKILKALLNWFVSMTKEYRKFQVVLCSSDSFMHSWVRNFVGNNRFNAIVIGYLSKDVEIFWNGVSRFSWSRDTTF